MRKTCMTLTSKRVLSRMTLKIEFKFVAIVHVRFSVVKLSTHVLSGAGM